MVSAVSASSSEWRVRPQRGRLSCSVAALAVALVLASSPAGSAAQSPPRTTCLSDTPYPQWKSSRFTFSGVSLAQWPVVPSVSPGSVAQVVTSCLAAPGQTNATAGEPLAWLVHGSSLSLLLPGPSPRVVAAEGLPAPLPAGGARLVAATDACGPTAGGAAVGTRTETVRVFWGNGTAYCTASTAGDVNVTCRAAPASFGFVSDASCTRDAGLCFVAASSGLWSVGSGGAAPQLLNVTVAGAAALTVAAHGATGDDPDLTVLATSAAHYYRYSASGAGRYAGPGWTTKWMRQLVYGIYGNTTATAAAFGPDGTGYIGAPGCVYVQHPGTDLERVDSRAGLPYNRTTSLSVSAGAEPGSALASTLWVGTRFGLVRRDPTVAPAPPGGGGPRASAPPRFLYFAGSRWLPTADMSAANNTVVSVSAAPSGTGAWAVTPLGMAYVRWEATTLHAKMLAYESIVAPRHDRYGLVSNSALSRFGDLRTSRTRPSDNDGLWTSVYTASMVFKYGVTGDPADKAAAWHHFGGIELLNNVTGIPGYPARSVLARNATLPRGLWWNSTTDPTLRWKGDTSSDEIVGHMFVMPLVHDILAETEAEKARVSDLLLGIVTNIVKNGFYLIGERGFPTTWGRWSPADLNRNITYYDERGVNSVQILSYLLSAERISGGDPLFSDALAYLVGENGFSDNMIDARIVEPSDTNYSDNELLFLPYFTWIYTMLRNGLEGRKSRAADDAVLQEQFDLSLNRSFRSLRPERADLWNYIYGARFPGPGNSTSAAAPAAAPSPSPAAATSPDRRCPLYSTETPFSNGDAAWTMRSWPAELIEWPYANTQRLDVPIDPYSGDGRAGVDSEPYFVLPPQEKAATRWNADPYSLDGGNGLAEADPGAIMLPYWMGRYLGFVSAPVAEGEAGVCSSPLAAASAGR